MRRARASGTRIETPSTLDAAIKQLANRKDAWASLSDSKKLHMLSSIGNNLRKVDLDSWSRDDAQLEGYDVTTVAGDTQAAKNSLRDTVIMTNVLNTLKRTLKGRVKGDERVELPIAPGGSMQRLVTFPTNSTDSLSTVGMMGLSGQVWCHRQKNPTVDVDAAIAKSTPSSPRSRFRRGRFSLRSSSPSPIARNRRTQSSASETDKTGLLCVVLCAHWGADLFFTLLGRLFNDNSVVLVQFDDVRSSTLQYYEQVFFNLIELGYVQFVSSRVELGCTLSNGLVDHPLVDSVHIAGTGTDGELVQSMLYGSSDETLEPESEPLELSRRGKLKALRSSSSGDSNSSVRSSKSSKSSSSKKGKRRGKKNSSTGSKRNKRESSDGHATSSLLFASSGGDSSSVVTTDDGGASPWVIIPGGKPLDESGCESDPSDDGASSVNGSRQRRSSTSSTTSSCSSSSSSSDSVLSGSWTSAELEHHARMLLAAVTSSGSCTSHTPRVLLLDSSWPHCDEFIQLVTDIASEMKPQPMHHPMALGNCEVATNMLQRMARKSSSHVSVLCNATVSCETTTMMTPLVGLVRMENTKSSRLDSKLAKLVSVQQGFPLLMVCTIDGDNVPEMFLASAQRVMHKSLAGSLSCTLIVHPSIEKTESAEIDSFIESLRYGVVCINQWSAFARMVPGVAWGTHQKLSKDAPSSNDKISITSNWSKNEYMLTNIDKSVVKSPFLHRAQPQVQSAESRVGRASRNGSELSNDSSAMAARRARLTRGFLMKPTVTGMLRMMMSPAPRSSSVGPIQFDDSGRKSRASTSSSYSSDSSWRITRSSSR